MQIIENKEKYALVLNLVFLPGIINLISVFTEG